MGSPDDIVGVLLTTDQCEDYLRAQHFKYAVKREDGSDDLIYYVDHKYGGWTAQNKDRSTIVGWLPNAPDLYPDSDAVWRVVERHVFEWEWEDEKLLHFVHEVVEILRDGGEYDFQALMCKFASMLHLEDEHLAELLKTSLPTIKLWKAGLSAPHPEVRRSVIDKLLERSREELPRIGQPLKWRRQPPGLLKRFWGLFRG